MKFLIFFIKLLKIFINAPLKVVNFDLRRQADFTNKKMKIFTKNTNNNYAKT